MSTVRLAFVGDVMLHAAIAQGSEQGDCGELFADVKEVFAQCTGSVINLECAYPSEETGPKEPRVIASPEALRKVTELNPAAVCLANNHVFDCGVSGFDGLTALLEDLGLAWFGAGRSMAEAAGPVIRDIGGLTFGFLGYVDAISTPTHVADASGAGICLYEEQAVLDGIAGLQGRCDHIVVCLHWGQEHLLVPAPGQIAAARRFIDAGARLVIGHHPHVLQGVEEYHKGLIAYSLGNFVTTETILDSGYRVPWSAESLLSCILTVDLGKEGVVAFEQLPTRITGGRVERLAGPNGRVFIMAANRRIARGVGVLAYQWHYFYRRVIKSFIGLIRRRGVFFIRPRHFKMLWREMRALCGKR